MNSDSPTPKCSAQALPRIGCDLVHIPRIAKSIEKKAFVDRVFSGLEIEYCNSKPQSAPHFAARFAAKEAFLKALGTGLFTNGMGTLDIEVAHESSGRPLLKLSAQAQILLEKAGYGHTDVSLSHHGEYAMATVILLPY